MAFHLTLTLTDKLTHLTLESLRIAPDVPVPPAMHSADASPVPGSVADVSEDAVPAAVDNSVPAPANPVPASAAPVPTADAISEAASEVADFEAAGE